MNSANTTSRLHLAIKKSKDFFKFNSATEVFVSRRLGSTAFRIESRFKASVFCLKRYGLTSVTLRDK